MKSDSSKTINEHFSLHFLVHESKQDFANSELATQVLSREEEFSKFL